MKLFKSLFSFLALTILNATTGIYAQFPVHVSRITQNLVTPVRVALDNDDNIYTTDVNQKRIAKYDVSGNFSGTISSGISPVSIAINKQNQVFVGDSETGKIFKLNANGTATEFYAGTFFPSDMVFCPDGLLYIVDSKLKQIIVLDISGNLVRTIGSGTLFYPTGIAYNPKTNRILVSEHGGIENDWGTIVEKIYIFDLQGTVISTFGSNGSGNGNFYRIQGMSVDRCGNIYVTDPFQGKISVFNENGVYITQFGVWGEGIGQVNVPLDIAINSKDNIWMTSLNNGALDLYKINFALPTSDMSSTNRAICLGDTISIPINFTGTAPWSFTYTIEGLNPTTINNVSNNPYILNVSQSGTYQITALSDSSKTGTCFSGMPTVTIDSLIPAANITSGSKLICTGDTTTIAIDLTGTAPWSLTYTIDGLSPATVNNISSNTFLLNASKAGMYEITALSGAGCNGTDITGNYSIALNPLPTLFYTNGNNSVATICAGETTDIPLGFTGTSPWSFSYSINGVQTFTVNNISTNPFILSATNPGVYELIEISDANCMQTKIMGQATVIVNPLPIATILESDLTVCQGETTSIHVSFEGIPPYNFTYTKDGANPVTVSNVTNNPYSITVSEGVYEITALSGLYCTGTSLNGKATVTAGLPTATILNTYASICSGDNASIAIHFTGTAPWYFTYTKDGINPITVERVTENPYYLSVSDPGIYQLISFSGVNCAGNILNATANVIISEAPTATIASGNTTLCTGGYSAIPIDFTGTPPFNFTYTKDGTNAVNISNVSQNPYILAVSEPGTYALAAISNASCTGTNISGTAVVTITPLPVVNLGADIQLCEGETVVLNAGASFITYQWNNFSTNQTLAVTAAGNYSVSVTDNNGCVNSDSVSVNVTALPLLAYTYTLNGLEISFTNSSINAGYYSWDFGDGDTSTVINPVHVYQNPGNYTITLTSSNVNCTSISSEIINIVASGVSVQNAVTGISIYPNPSRGIFNVEIINLFQSGIKIEIVDVAGKMVYSENYNSPADKAVKMIDLSGFANGIYTLRVITGEITKTERLTLSY